MHARTLRPIFLLLIVSLASVVPGLAQGSLSNGGTQSGSLGPNSSASWTFSVPAGTVWDGTLSPAPTSGESFYVTITRGSDGLEFVAGYNVVKWGGGGANAPGDSYVILIRRLDTKSGSENYTITNTVVPPPAGYPIVLGNDGEGGPMIDELPLAGSVDYGDLDVYWFDANASDPGLYVEMDYSGDAQPNLVLVGPNGGESDNCNTPSPAGPYQHNCSFYNNLAGRIYVLVTPPNTQEPRSDPIGYSLTLHNSTAALAGNTGKENGAVPCNCSGGPDAKGMAGAGDPINISNGNVFDSVTDYTTAGQNPLALIRSYNSAGNLQQTTSFAASLGPNWRTNFDRYLHLLSSTVVEAERADGQILTFRLKSSVWKPDTDSDYRLTNSGTSWTLTGHDDTAETYTAISSTEAQLTRIATSAGYAQTLAYSGGQLESVTDSYSRKLGFTYTGADLTGVTTPDTLQLTYGFDTAGGHSRLTSVSYNTVPETSQTYLYENASFPFALTGITDENGVRYSTWGYDTQGRGVSSQLAGGAGATTILYAANGFSAVVTNPLGVKQTYKFKTLQDVEKIIEIDRHDPSGSLPDATETFTYDANGYRSEMVDWNGNQTYYTNDAYGDPTIIYEAYGSAVARTTHIAYDTTWVRKPKTVALGNLTTGYTYDAAAGTLLTKILTDGSASRGAYAPNTLTWTYTYTSTGQLQTVKAPRTDIPVTTTYAYTGGTLTSIVNPLKQTTTINTHTPGGLPTKITDPNGVVTSSTYTPRNWLLTSSIAMAAGARTTIYGYDKTGNLTGVQQPGTAKLAYGYDTAHRLTKITDLFGQTINFTLDRLGDRTGETIKNAAGAIQMSRSDKFDALGRRLTHTGGASQVTEYAYDANGNVTSIIDPLKHPATIQTFDALNRVSQMTDRAAGITKFTYDAYDKPVTVVTPNGATTSYVYDGYEAMVKQVSPDSGTTYSYYDGDGNLTKTQNALNIIANSSYDALDRRTGIVYPASTPENVTYIYDQAGHGFGIDRMTGMTDQAGTFTRSYDERGNITSESHTHGSYALKTGYGYDAAGLATSQTYPDGMILSQVRDTMERITGLALKPSSTGASQTIVSGVAYQPFGPAAAFTYGNGIADSRTFDADYRLTKVADTGTAALQSLTYALNANDNVTGITDAVTSANSQALTYDALDRLLTAKGAYGSESFGYDGNGNRTALNGTAWTYTANTNRLAKIGTQVVTPNATGNITNIAYATAAGFTYNNANRLATATSGGSTVFNYLYDGFGQRVGKTDSAQRFEAYDQFGRYIEQTDNTVTTKRDYIYVDGLPVATFVPNGSTGTLSFLHTNRLGTPRLATNASKAVGWSMTTADPFGAGPASTGSIANELRFPGQENELGLTSFNLNHNGWRDYAPGMGRYLESDPIGLNGGQASTYAYVGSNPGSFIDPTGLETPSVTLGLPSDSAAYPFGGYHPLPPSIDCPTTVEQCENDPDFSHYPGKSEAFHCSETGFEQMNAPAGHKIQECFYTPTGNLDTGWCGGSPDDYKFTPAPWSSGFWNHSLFDRGGPMSVAGGKGFVQSRWRDMIPAAY